jgi:RNA recognition motif-containing protein
MWTTFFSKNFNLQFGKIREVRLLVKDGVPKGAGFIEFENEVNPNNFVFPLES